MVVVKLKFMLPLVAALAGAACTVAAAPFLGTAQGFSVLGATPDVANTGATTLTGDVGVSPAASITGLNTITVNGTNGAAGGNPSVHENDAVAKQAQIDSLGAFNILKSQSVTGNKTGQDLGGLTLQPGVYRFDSSAQLTGTLTLDALNLPNAVFIFQIGSTLTTASGAVVNVIDGLNGANDGIFWEVGSSATLGTTTVFAGNIIADQTVALATGAKILCGRAIALHAEVTMDTNTISNDCTAANGDTSRSDFGSKGFSGFGGALVVVSAPEPATVSLLGMGLLGLLLYRRRSAK